MITQNEIALKILNIGKDGYKNDAEGFEKLNQANALIENHVQEQLRLHDVSQHRELLNAFQKHYQSESYDDEMSFNWNISNFLKAFNCG